MLNLFLSKININNYEIEEIEHSFHDNDGENDVTVVVKNAKEKVGLLIEDKIDAIAMPHQRDRYIIRGNKLVDKNRFDRFFLFIVAPKDYLESNTEAKKYDNNISYEEMKEYFKDDLYAYSLFEKALEEKKKGYIVIENKNVTLFWKRYYDFVEENYPKLKINRIEGPRGDTACWPIFLLPIKNVFIYHKSDRGYMDLTFEKQADNYYNFINAVKDKLTDAMSVQKTGKSLVIRINIPIVDFKSSFDDYIPEMKECLDKAMILNNFLTSIDINKILSKDN